MVVVVHRAPVGIAVVPVDGKDAPALILQQGDAVLLGEALVFAGEFAEHGESSFQKTAEAIASAVGDQLFLIFSRYSS
jgi:hypothetical protein